jgi:hypothetical protein
LTEREKALSGKFSLEIPRENARENFTAKGKVISADGKEIQISSSSESDENG